MSLKERARLIKRDIMSLYFALKHPQTPWYSKILILLIIGYALSPIDLIPDFIPILGYLDDVILLPLAILLAIKTLPKPVLAECREKARAWSGKRPRSIAGAVIVAAVWLTVLFAVLKIVFD